MNAPRCPFCFPPEDRILGASKLALALTDGFPISDGHALVVPRRHVASVYDLDAEEQAAIWALVADIRADLARRLQPDGFNVGLNDGGAVGKA